MPETPTAAPAAPVAPVAPVAAPAAPAAPVAAPAAPAAPADPVAPVAAPVAPDASAGEESSLLDGVPEAVAPVVELTAEQKLEAARELIKKAEEAANPNNGKSWLLNEGVMGVGEKPGWFKADKYKTVAAQAEAYTNLESRFGSFVGAPKDGKYAFTPPEGVQVQMDHPLMQGFTKWASEKQLSQEGYNELLGMLVQYEAAHAPDMAEVKSRLGDNADTRISQSAQFVKANLGAEGMATFKAATTGKNADAVFKLVESLIAKSGQVRMPKPGADVPGAQVGDAYNAIISDYKARDGQGRLRIDNEKGYREGLEKRLREHFANQAA